LPRRLVVAGVIVTGIGLVMLGYLDPVLRGLFFSGTLTGSNGSTFTRTTETFNVNFTNGPIVFSRGSGTVSLVSVATIIVFFVTVIGLLLTIAGSFASGGGIPTGAGPAPAASSGEEPSRRTGRLAPETIAENRY